MNAPLDDYVIRRGRRIAVLVAGIISGAAGCGPSHDDALTAVVFAAASLTEPFTELGRAFESVNPDITVRFNFAGSQQLALQIMNGAEADVFASADSLWMNHLLERNLVEEPEVCCYNGLVVVTPRSNPANIQQVVDLARPGVKLVIGAETVPVGRYARNALRRMSASDGFPADFGDLALANVVSEEENVKAVAAKVQLGEADAGIVYRSDVSASIRESVTILDIPPDAQVVAIYPIAILTAATNSRQAEAFVHFVRSPDGQSILMRHGFATSHPRDESAH